MHRAEVHLPLDRERARKVAEALRPEAAAEVANTKLHIEREPDGLLLVVEAKDSSGLRAALNSYMRLALVAMEITKGRETHGSSTEP